MSSKLLNYPSASSNPHLGAGGSAGSSTATRNGTTGHGSSQLNFENLQLDDILCTVCQSVLVEPVFLPCQHRFCRNCLSGTIEKNNLNCPCCRKRFGTWYRNASRVNKLVHEQLWNAIQSQFRDYLDEDGTGRCNGNGSVGGCFVPQTESVIHLSEPGEIRKEYETELQRYRKELIEEKKKELAASEKYIINLYKQEGIIDLVDSSDHLSISSTTSTPEPPAKNRNPPQPANQEAKAHEIVEDDEEAGPSGSGHGEKADNQPPGVQNQTSVVTSSSNNVNSTSRPETSKSQSNGSVISISSTSSASGASSSCISSASSRYSLVKQQPTSTKAQSSNEVSKHGSNVGAVTKKVFTMAELNQNELCVKPTKLHRRNSSQAVDDEDDDDGDSLRSELNHFKPIFATTPKSCFSSKAIVRVPSVRPETGSLPSSNVECFSPSKSPFKPIDPTTPRRSAFSVVNVSLFTPPTTTDAKTAKAQKRKVAESVGKKQKAEAPSSSVKAKKAKSSKKANVVNPDTERRKRKLKFSPQPKAKVKVEPSSASSNDRITRRSLTRQPSRLKDLIVSDQQRRAALIEQERRDFEFAQKLQKKLNRTRGATILVVDSLPREAPKIVARKQNSTYSLRRHTMAVQHVAVATELPPPPPSSNNSSSRSDSRREAPSRKRKAPSKVNESPKAIQAPTTPKTMKQIKKPKRQAETKTTKTRQPSVQEAPSTEEVSSESRILRRSTRIRS
ncbi:AAEL001357-PA [Aedes aegypti]|uniref:RING-type E3 ubiquitin transferase n=2 Tax=Aedes aegypti TaxID=7159 RepID=Q17LI8_AEDAE|nr:serine/arginine repetitive matrix protein 2 [Aedes aegypti]EAT47548.1 AAEL001357-PA [Aedes aegypti]